MSEPVRLTQDQWFAVRRVLRRVKPLFYQDILDSSLCPKIGCGTLCKLVDYLSVDVGVGTIVGEREWFCPTHGEWAIDGRGDGTHEHPFKYQYVFREEALNE